MPALLEARALHAGYGETRVLHGIDFAVEEGGVTALLGANGAGKTTTLRAICGMVRTQRRDPLRRRAHRRQGDRGHRAPRRRACAGRPRHVHGADGRGEPPARRLYPPRPAGVARGFRAHVRLFSRGCASGSASRPARCRAASSRCWRSRGRCCCGRSCCCWTSRRSAWRR